MNIFTVDVFDPKADDYKVKYVTFLQAIESLSAYSALGGGAISGLHADSIQTWTPVEAYDVFYPSMGRELV